MKDRSKMHYFNVPKKRETGMEATSEEQWLRIFRVDINPEIIEAQWIPNGIN